MVAPLPSTTNAVHASVLISRTRRTASGTGRGHVKRSTDVFVHALGTVGRSIRTDAIKSRSGSIGQRDRNWPVPDSVGRPPAYSRLVSLRAITAGGTRGTKTTRRRTGFAPSFPPSSPGHVIAYRRRDTTPARPSKGPLPYTQTHTRQEAVYR